MAAREVVLAGVLAAGVGALGLVVAGVATRVVGAGVVATRVVGAEVVPAEVVVVEVVAAGSGLVAGLSVTKLGEKTSSVKMAGLNGQIPVHSKPAMMFF